MKIRKGDKVIMLSGKDKGKSGSVLRVDVTANKVVVQGLNQVKRHTKPRKQGQKGQILTVERWVSAAAVAYVSKETGKPTRVGWQVDAEGKNKVRIDKKSGAQI